MASPEIRIKGLAEFEAKLEKLGKDFHSELVKGMETSNLYMKGQISPYPAPVRMPFEFVTDRQRLFVILSILSGTLTVPYKRRGSGGIGGSINTEVRSVGSDVVGVIGSSSEHAPWVISDTPTEGRGPQASYHKGTWWTLQKVVNDNIKGYVDTLAKVLSDVIR